jgi:hypothetical protein
MNITFNKKDEIDIDVNRIKDEHFILIKHGRALYTIKRVSINEYAGIVIKEEVDDCFLDNQKGNCKKTFLIEVIGKKDGHIYYAFNTYKEWLDKVVELSGDEV